jgi:hypothetical protein
MEILKNCCDDKCDNGVVIFDAVSRLPREPNAVEVSVARCFCVGQKMKVYNKKSPHLLKGEMEIIKVPHPKSGSNTLHFKELLRDIKVGDFLIVTSRGYGMKNLETLRNEQWYARLQAELKVELDAAQDYYERTGNVYQNLSPTFQRKVIENFKEDHEKI